MRLSSLVPALLCTALGSLVLADQRATAQILPTDVKATGIPAFIHNIWQTVINGGRPLDLDARAKGDEEAGMTRITDDNYAQLFSQGRPDDVWVIAVHGRSDDLMSSGYLQMHTNASTLLKENGTIADQAARFKFARLDWMTDWVVCTRWVLSKPPYVAFVSDSGQTLRFASPPRLPANGTTLYTALADGYWKNLPPWKGSLAPGGDNAYLVEAYIAAQRSFAHATAWAPKWAWLGVPFLLTMIGQKIMVWLHSGDEEAQRKRAADRARLVAAAAAKKPTSQ